MAKLMLSPCNVLALDEPTNHMDIRSKDVLKQALQAFDGTLIVVSHDRDFLEGLVDKLYEFRDGAVKEHLGGVQEFLERRKLESLSELERRGEAVVAARPVQQQPVAAKAEQQRSFQEQKERSRQERKVRSRIQYLEKEIGALEAQMAAIEKTLANPGEKDDIMELTRAYLEHKMSLDAHTEEWTQLMEQLDE